MTVFSSPAIYENHGTSIDCAFCTRQLAKAIKYECHDSMLNKAWWVSRDCTIMSCLDGASGTNICACAMNNP